MVAKKIADSRISAICPACNSRKSRVRNTYHRADKATSRSRVCLDCGFRYETFEVGTLYFNNLASQAREQFTFEITSKMQEKLDSTPDVRLSATCPVCNSTQTFVKDSRQQRQKNDIGIPSYAMNRRRRVCCTCDARYTTYEIGAELIKKIMKSKNPRVTLKKIMCMIDAES